MRRERELPPLLEPQRRRCVASRAEGRSGGAERPCDDQQVSRPRARPPGHAFAPTEGGDRDHDRLRRGRVAAQDRDTRFGEPFVEVDHVGQSRRSRNGERDQERVRLRARGREVAEVDRRGAKTEAAPVDPVEPEVDVLDEGVLRHDEPVSEERRIVLDAGDQAAGLEVREQAELTDLGQPRQRPS